MDDSPQTHRKLAESFSILIPGARTASGNIAIDIAHHLGAKRVVGVVRNLSALKELGLDNVI